MSLYNHVANKEEVLARRRRLEIGHAAAQRAARSLLRGDRLTPV
jgi:hypothetical protein